MTTIREVFEAYAAMPVRLNDAAVTTWTPWDMKNRVNAPALPLRVLSPVGTNQTMVVTPLSLAGDGALSNLTIYDLLLIAPVTKGRGIVTYGGDLLEAIEAYRTAVRNIKARLMAGVLIDQVTADSAVFSYNETPYFAVEFQAQVSRVQ
jgi:hypothetical protein